MKNLIFYTLQLSEKPYFGPRAVQNLKHAKKLTETSQIDTILPKELNQESVNALI